MRKRCVNHIADTLMWYLIYLFPLVFVLCGSVLNTDAMTFFNSFLTWFEIAMTNNPIYTPLSEIFGATGLMPLFVGNWSFMLYYGTYFVSCMILHLAVDVIVFIPRLAHKYMSVLTREEE